MKLSKAAIGIGLAMAVAGSTASLAKPATVAAKPTKEATGRIERLNVAARHLTVNHHMYRYSPSTIGLALHRGEHVRVIYRERDGHRYAVQILPAA
jgi:hypothetical protein